MYREHEKGSAAIGGRENTVDLSKGASSSLNPFCVHTGLPAGKGLQIPNTEDRNIFELFST